MITMDVFKQDAFSATSLTDAVDKIGYIPSFLGDIPGLFDPPPLGQPRTPDIWIESRGTEPALIQTSPRGAPPKQKGGDDASREARPFRTRRLAQASRITPDLLQSIRLFGSETELKQLSTEIFRRQLLIKRDFELTLENLRLGCVQGVVKDADGTTIYDWAAEFGQAIPAELNFDLGNPAKVIAKKCATVTRSITRGLKGLGAGQVQIVGICGDDFFDDFVAHPEWREWQTSWPQATQLTLSKVFREVTFCNIKFVNYRGTDDGTTVSVNTDKCKFFPVGAGIFQMAFAPAERFGFVNTPGQPNYSWIVLDDDRDMFADVEMYSYPLPVCTMPQALFSAKRT